MHKTWCQQNSSSSVHNSKVITPSKRRGASERRAYTNNFKMMVINVCKTQSVNDSYIALQYNIDKSIIRKWKKQEKKICVAARIEHLKMLRKKRPSTRHKEVYKKLLLLEPKI